MARIDLIRLQRSVDDHGVYVSGWRNGWGTSLAYRGTLDDCQHLNIELRVTGTLAGTLVLTDGRTGERVQPAGGGEPW